MFSRSTAIYTLTLAAALSVSSCSSEEESDEQSTSISVDELVGSWSGHMLDETNDQTESVDITLTQDGNQGTLVVDVGPRGVNVDPDPVSLTFRLGSDDSTLGVLETAFHPLTGNLRGSMKPDGTLEATYGTFGLTIVVTGQVDAARGQLDLEIDANAGPVDFFSGRAVLCKVGAEGGCEATPAKPVAAPDCSPVVATAERGNSCVPGGLCEVPDGACVNGTCLQSCIPSQCEDLCEDNESCVSLAGQTLPAPDGRPLGACSGVDPGNREAYQSCGGPEGFCRAGLKCLSLVSGTSGQCLPPCLTSADCPAGPSGEPASCSASEPSSGQRYCLLGCTPTGNEGDDSQCPQGMRCEASPAGGNCLFPIPGSDSANNGNGELDGDACFENETIPFATVVIEDVAGICPSSFNSCPPVGECLKACSDLVTGTCANVRGEFVVTLAGDLHRFDLEQEGWKVISSSHGTPHPISPERRYNSLPADTEITVTFEDNQQRPGSIRFTASSENLIVHRYVSPGIGDPKE